jgi:ABC-type glutathione transport system ATPase component
MSEQSQTHDSALIRARGLTKRFGDFTAVDGVDFDVAPGESFGFLGPNGAGKTSTMRMIGCVSPITGGELEVLGRDPRDAWLRERVGVSHGEAAVTDDEAAVLGRLAARARAIRHLSLSVARSLDAGAAPAVEAALVKEVGTRFEQDLVEALRDAAETELDQDSGSLFTSLLAEAVLTSPSYTLRGGTTEVLRSVAAKGLAA